MSKIINGVRIDSPNKVTLCGDDICCPTVERLKDGRIVITDDYGKSVILTVEQAKRLGYGVNLLESNLSDEQLICG